MRPTPSDWHAQAAAGAGQDVAATTMLVGDARAPRTSGHTSGSIVKIDDAISPGHSYRLKPDNRFEPAFIDLGWSAISGGLSHAECQNESEGVVITNTWTPPPAPPTPQKRNPGKVVARVIGGSILGLAGFGFMHGGFRSDHVSTATTQPTASAEGTPTSAAVDGFTFTPPANDYSVVFPTKPTTNQKTVHFPDGSDAPVTLYVSVTSDRAFETSALTYPPGTVPSFDAARDGIVANVSGTLTSSTPITLQGRAGLQFTVRTHDGQRTYLARFYYDGVNSYQVIAVVAGEATFDDPQIAAFFDSFRFTVDR